MNPSTVAAILAVLALAVLSGAQLVVVDPSALKQIGRRAGRSHEAGREVEVCPEAFPSGLSLSCRRSGVFGQPPITIRFVCRGKPMMPAVAPMRTPAPDMSPCVRVPAQAHLGPASPPAWALRPGGALEFRPGNASQAIAGADETAPLLFAFGVPRAGRYAFVVDMTTKGMTSHNDIYVNFLSGGFVLHKMGRPSLATKGFRKAYHNENGRAIKSFSIDSDAHSFRTREVLAPGFVYYFAIAGRSTMVTVHRIIMFPCQKIQCESTSVYWRNMVSKCS